MADNTPTGTMPLLLDRYRVERKLGEGGLGTVVCAYDTRLKRRVAIKTLRRPPARNTVEYATLADRFTREAEAGSRVGNHPNLVTVHDLVTDSNDTLYLILEFVPGGTLADQLRDGPLPLEDALRLTGEIALGLQAMHRQGLVHRDVKPANIFLSDEGQAQLGDFGIVQIDDLSRRPQNAKGHPGTPLYQSPEQASTTDYLRPASDQYSLGLVLFEMLTGTIYKRLDPREAASLLAPYPAPLQALIARMLAPDPLDRYPSMAEVGQAIRRIAREYALTTTLDAPLASDDATGRAATDISDDSTATIRATDASQRTTPQLDLTPISPVLDRPPAIALPPSTESGPRRGRRRLAVTLIAAVVLLLIGVVGVEMIALSRNATDARQHHYALAEAALATKDYDTAIAEFAAAGDYRNASQRVSAIQQQRSDAQRDAERQQAYDQGKDALAQENYPIAVAAFTRAGSYADAPDQLTLAQTRATQQRQYQAGDDAFGREDFTAAALAFRLAVPYRDAATRVAQAEDLRDRKTAYDMGAAAFAKEDYKTARQAFTAAGNYKDAVQRVAQSDEEDGLLTLYNSAQAHLKVSEFKEAYADLLQIKQRRAPYKNINDILSHLENDVANPITIDLFTVLNQSNGYTEAWLPVNNLIGQPIAYLYVSLRRYSTGRPDLIGSVDVQLTRQQGSRVLLSAENATFATDTEIQDNKLLRRDERLFVATSAGQVFETPDFGKYRAKWTVTNVTAQPKAQVNPTTVTADPVFTRLVLSVTLTPK